ncbi:MAG: UDP-N-acetylmuramate dehydrogenase [Desulforhopalus sp.]
MNSEQKIKLTTLSSQAIKWHCRLDRYTSLAIGGPADALIKVEKREELQQLLAFLIKEQIPWRVVGRGTNLLVKDKGFAGVIFLLGGDFNNIERDAAGAADSVIVKAGAGSSLTQISFRCIEWGLTGVEFACGIPGSLGGAVIMNAGAWGGEMSSIVENVRLMTADGEKIFARHELDFSYRCWKSFAPFLGKAVVTEVELKLKNADIDTIRQNCSILQDRRKQIQLCKYPNAGSFFKNPANDSAGRLIDVSGLKGLTVGGAMISEHHGNFLVNKGNATAEDVMNLMKIVQAKVKNDSGVALEPEVHFI